MKSIKDKEKELLADFEMLPEWNDRYNYIMDLGAELPQLPDEAKNADNKVEGCQSASWLTVTNKDGRLYFQGDSEAILGKGVISMLLNMLNGAKAEEIANYDFYLIDAIDLSNHLSPTRKMGLESVIKRIKELANENLNN
ncbi:MAG TPA: SufE family protein [Flavobacteriales bacterium]|nr:SufE family protein [Flavobacteriales bacterium]